jgi:hypothetical protein
VSLPLSPLLPLPVVSEDPLSADDELGSLLGLSLLLLPDEGESPDPLCVPEPKRPRRRWRD